MKTKLQLIRAIPNFYTIEDNPRANLLIFGFSFYTRCFALTENVQKKAMDMVAYTTVEFNWLQTIAITFIFPPGQDQ